MASGSASLLALYSGEGRFLMRFHLYQMLLQGGLVFFTFDDIH
jgi:hypothetical protein